MKLKQRLTALLLSGFIALSTVTPAFAEEVDLPIEEQTAVQSEEQTPETDPTEEPEASEEEETSDPVDAETTQEIQDTVIRQQIEISGAQDSEELLEEYLFSAADDVKESDAQAVAEKEYELNDQEQALFDYMKGKITSVASGERSSTKIIVPTGTSNLFWTYEELGLGNLYEETFATQEEADAAGQAAAQTASAAIPDKISISKVINCLYAAMPYEFYWLMEQSGVSYNTQYSFSKEGVTVSLTFFYTVKSSYRSDSSDPYTMDTDQAVQAAAAAEKVQSIVDQAAGKSDVEKLQYYKEQICALVTYDEDAASTGLSGIGSSLNGDPWQIINVFDDDTSTNVVCEGYSKAFQFLCSKTAFDSSSIRCLQVSGVMLSDGETLGNHMWNVVIMENKKSYLVDVTNSDEGTSGSDGELFLAGAEGDVVNGYTVSFPSGHTLSYVYNDKTRSIYSAGKLTLSSLSYGALSSCTHDDTETMEKNRIEPTCTEAGSYDEVVVCSICGKEISRETKTIAAAGHTWEDAAAVDQEATCTEAGSKSIHCQHCDATKEATEIPALGHSFTNYVSNDDATCTADGTKTAKCDRCSVTDTKTETGSALGHSFGAWTVVKEATCTEAGSEKRTCSRCDYSETRTIETLEHSWNTEYTVDQEATCTEAGSKSVHCQNCDAAKEATEIPALGHSFTNYVSDENAACTEDGTKTAKCDRCDETDTIADEGSALGHDLGAWTVTKAATCTETGTEKRTCSRCDYSETRTVETQEHSWNTEYTVDQEATCTEAGSKSVHCQNCDAAKNVTEIPALGHAFTNYVSDENAACTEDGTKTAKCDRCDVTDTIADEGSALGHSFGAWTVVKAATCTEAGSEKRICSRCNAFETRTIEAAGHHWETAYTVDTAATCTEAGSKSIHCQNCDAAKNVTEIPALGHSFTNYVSNEDAACLTDGTETAKCDRCDETDTRKDEGSALGHSFTNYISNEDAACTADGTKTAKCDRCDAIDTIADAGTALGHSFTNYVSNGDATCTADGTKTAKCDRCDVTDTIADEGSALGHHYGDWVVIKAPTTSKTGSKYQTCTRCGNKETKTMPKLKKQTLTGTSSYSRTYGAADFTLNAKTNGDGKLTYSSSKTSVATVDETGKVHVVGVGTATITVKATGTEAYTAATKSVTVKVSKAAQTITTDESAYTRYYGDASFNLNAAASAGGKLTYKSSSTKVAAVSANGTVTLKGAGTATITITAASTSNYNSITKKVTVKVLKVSQTVSAEYSSYERTGGDAAFNLNASTTGNGKLTYKSSKTSVVTVSSTGLVTLKGAGTATITVSAASTAGCNAASAKVTITVTKGQQEISGPDTISKVRGAKAFSLGCTAKTKLTYQSSDPKIATVSSSGKVTMKKAGEVTITVTAASSSLYNSAKKEIKIVVS